MLHFSKLRREPCCHAVIRVFGSIGFQRLFFNRVLTFESCVCGLPDGWCLTYRFSRCLSCLLLFESNIISRGWGGQSISWMRCFDRGTSICVAHCLECVRASLRTWSLTTNVQRTIIVSAWDFFRQISVMSEKPQLWVLLVFCCLRLRWRFTWSWGRQSR